MKIQFSKGTVPKQAHVAIPEGLIRRRARPTRFLRAGDAVLSHPPADRLETHRRPVTNRGRSTPTTSSRVIARIHAASRQSALQQRCRFVYLAQVRTDAVLFP
jgi:hypothetical protein